jgi:hypothetical protein
MLNHKKTKKLLRVASETVRNMRPGELRQVIGGGGDPTYPGSGTCESGKLTCICLNEW